MKNQTPRHFLQRLAQRRRVRILNLTFATCLFAGGAASSSLRAADGTWISDANGAWSDSLNWANNGTIADGAGSTAFFAYGITGNRVITNDTPRTIGNLLFDDTGTGTTVDATGDSVWTLTGTAANALTFSGGGGTSTITTNSTVGYGNEFVISAVVTGSNNLVFNSTQTAGTAAQRFLVINNVANSYTGTTTLTNGYLDVGNNSILAAGSPLGISSSAIVLGNAGTVANTAGGSAPTTGLRVGAAAATSSYTIDRNIDSSATADVAGRTDIGFFTGPVGATGTLTISGNWALGTTNTVHSYGLAALQPGQTLNFTGNITGPGTTTSLRINDYGGGNGMVRLAGMNTYGGTTLVEEGTLIIGSNAPATGPGALGNNATLQLASGGVTGVNSVNANATLSALTDGAYTVGKTVALISNVATVGGVANLQQAYSWTLGGNSANASTYTGAVNSPNVAFSRTLNLTQAANGSSTFSGIIGANADAANVTTVEKTGAGTVVFSGPNTYDGGTRITGGTLLVNGGVAGTSSGSGTGSVTVGVVSAAQTAVSGSIANSGTGTFVTRQINNISNTVAAGLQVGQTVTGTGITAGAVIQSIGLNAAAGGTASIVISTPITVAATTGNTYTDLAFGALTTSGTLGGTGVVAPSLTASLVTVNAGSTLAPGVGTTPGILSIVAGQTGTPASVGAASLNLLAGSNLSIKLNGAIAGTGYDQVNVTGNVALGGGNLVLTLNGLTTTGGQTFVLINNDGTDAVLGTFAGLADGQTFTSGGQMFRINYNAVGGTDSIPNDVVLTAVVPEPGTWATLALGLGAFALARLRRTRAV